MNSLFMKYAYKESLKALNKNEVPIGAVIVKDGKIISRAYNTKNKSNFCFNHAEVLCIKKATKKLNNWRLDGCDIYITLEPCPMCASLIHQSRIDNVYFILNQKNIENNRIINNIFNDKTSNKLTKCYQITDEWNYIDLLQNFFQKKR